MNNTRTIYFSKNTNIVSPAFLIGAAVGDEAVTRDILAKYYSYAPIIKTNESPKYASQNTKSHTDIIMQLHAATVYIDVKTPSFSDSKISFKPLYPNLFYSVIAKHPNDNEAWLWCVKGEELAYYASKEQNGARITLENFKVCLQKCSDSKKAMAFLTPIPVSLEDYKYLTAVREIAAKTCNLYPVDTGEHCISALAEIAKITGMQDLYETRYKCRLQFKASEDALLR